MQLIEVEPLKPFVGSYKCGMAEADVIEDEAIEKDGIITKVKVARKRFAGFIPVERVITPDEQTRFATTKPDNIEVFQEGRVTMVREWPKERTVKVPADVASQLVSRGLARTVSRKAEKASAA